jgi:hypothetical protein
MNEAPHHSFLPMVPPKPELTSDLTDTQLQDVFFEATMDKNFDQCLYVELVAEMNRRRFLAHA